MNPCASAVRASREACPTGTLLCLLHGTGAEGVHLAAGCETSGSGRGRSGRVRVCGRAGLARLTQRRISRAGPEGAASARLHRGGGRGREPAGAPGVNRPDSGIVVFFRKPTTRLRRDHPGMPHTPPLRFLEEGRAFSEEPPGTPSDGPSSPVSDRSALGLQQGGNLPTVLPAGSSDGTVDVRKAGRRALEHEQGITLAVKIAAHVLQSAGKITHAVSDQKALGKGMVTAGETLNVLVKVPDVRRYMSSYTQTGNWKDLGLAGAQVVTGLAQGALITTGYATMSEETRLAVQASLQTWSAFIDTLATGPSTLETQKAHGDARRLFYPLGNRNIETSTRAENPVFGAMTPLPAPSSGESTSAGTQQASAPLAEAARELRRAETATSIAIRARPPLLRSRTGVTVSGRAPAAPSGNGGGSAGNGMGAGGYGPPAASSGPSSASSRRGRGGGWR